MKKLIEAIKNDKELQTLLKEYEILTGKYMLYHYDNFNGIEEYKEDIRKRIEEYKKNNYY